MPMWAEICDKKWAPILLVPRARSRYVARMGLNDFRMNELMPVETRAAEAPLGLGTKHETKFETPAGAKFVTNSETPGAAGHPESYCPNCSAELQEHRCKLTCDRCGFYLSCSDFY